MYLPCPSGVGGSRLDQSEDLKPSDASGSCSTCDARHCARTAVVLASFPLADAHDLCACAGGVYMTTSYEDNFGFWEIDCPEERAFFFFFFFLFVLLIS